MLLHNFSENAPGAVMLGSFIFVISALFTCWKNYGLVRKDFWGEKSRS